MKTRIIFAVLLLLLPTGLPQASGSVTSGGKGHVAGKIRNSSNNLPIEDANIELFSATDSSLVAGTITDCSGFFTVFRLDTGKYYLVIQSPEFRKNEILPFSINQSSGKIDLGEINLTPSCCLEYAGKVKTKPGSKFESAIPALSKK